MPSTGSSREHAANVLGALSLVVADRMRASVEEISGLGPSAPAALAALHEFLDGGSVAELGSVLGLTHSGTVRLVDRLGAAGLVERAGAADGRVVSVVLTPAGRRTARRVRHARAASLTGALDALGADQVDHLAEALDTMLTALTLARSEERTAAAPDRRPPWLCRLCDFAACGRSHGDCPVDSAVVSRGGRQR